MDELDDFIKKVKESFTLEQLIVIIDQLNFYMSDYDYDKENIAAYMYRRDITIKQMKEIIKKNPNVFPNHVIFYGVQFDLNDVIDDGVLRFGAYVAAIQMKRTKKIDSYFLVDEYFDRIKRNYKKSQEWMEIENFNVNFIEVKNDTMILDFWYNADNLMELKRDFRKILNETKMEVLT